MRIVFIANNSWNLYNFRIGLIKQLILNRNKVTIISNYDKYTQCLIDTGCDFEEINFSRKGTNFFSELKVFFSLFKIIRKVKPKIIFNFTIKPVIYSSFIARLLKIYSINTITGLGTVFIKKNYFFRFVIIFLYKISLKKSYKIFFQNKYDHRYFKKLKIVNSNTHIVAGSGVDINKYIYYQRFKKEKMNFLFIGRLTDDKGFADYIRASIIICRKYQNTGFDYIGNFEEKKSLTVDKKLLQQYEEKKYIKYHGFKDDVKEMIINSDCVILPSQREGRPHGLLIACAIGRPIIASDVPGCKDVVDHHINGFLSKKNNVNSLVECIESFLKLDSNQIDRMCMASRKKAEKIFDEKLIIKEYLSVIKNL